MSEWPDGDSGAANENPGPSPLTKALILVVSTLMASSLPAFAQSLTADEFRAEIVGRKLETKRMGLTARLVFSPDNAVAMQAPIGSAKGIWSLEGNDVCVTMNSGPQQGTRCDAFERAGRGQYRNAQGRTFTVR